MSDEPTGPLRLAVRFFFGQRVGRTVFLGTAWAGIPPQPHRPHPPGNQWQISGAAIGQSRTALARSTSWGLETSCSFQNRELARKLDRALLSLERVEPRLWLTRSADLISCGIGSRSGTELNCRQPVAQAGVCWSLLENMSNSPSRERPSLTVAGLVRTSFLDAIAHFLFFSHAASHSRALV